jgi:lipid-A-disaccharide synthase
MSSTNAPIKIAFIAGEKSGDLLGGDLIAAIKDRYDGPVDLVGVGGEAMASEGLTSLFNYEELSIVGYSAVIARLPQLMLRIRSTVRAVVAAKPDVLVIIDSPAFTHRVAKSVHRAMSDLPIINYICPTVWAWKPERAAQMTRYVDHILSVFPFEAEIVAQLEGPPVTYVGHRLMSDVGLLRVTNAQDERRLERESTPAGSDFESATCLILPGSRSGEVKRLLPDFLQAASELSKQKPNMRFVIPTLPRLESEIRAATSEGDIKIEITTGEDAKWEAFLVADAALAASGTVLLELALAGIPCISAYKLDPVAKLMIPRINAWTAALPNLIADYPVINEYFNESVRPGLMSRRLGRLTSNSSERRNMLKTFSQVREAMKTRVPASGLAADIVLRLASKPPMASNVT